MVTYETFKDAMKKKNDIFNMEHTDEKYRRMYGTVHLSAYGLPSDMPSEHGWVVPDVQHPLRYQIELPLSERRRFGEFGREINRLEAKIERLEKALASKSIPKNISTSTLENMTKTTIEKELNETLYEPLSKGIAFATGITSIVSLLLVSIIMFFPLALLSGMFWWSYYKFRQKRIHPYSYYISENIFEKSDKIKWKKYIPTPK